MTAPTICTWCDMLDDPARGLPCPCTAWRLAHAKGVQKPRKPRRRPVPARASTGAPKPARKPHSPPSGPRRDRWVPVLDIIAAAVEHHHTTTTTQAGAA